MITVTETGNIGKGACWEPGHFEHFGVAMDMYVEKSHSSLDIYN